MLPGVGWGELLIIAIVALIVIGPADLPRVLRTVGRFTGKARAMAREFQSSFEEIAREAEMEEMRKEAEKLRASLDAPAGATYQPPLSPDDEDRLMREHNSKILESEAIAAEQMVPLSAGGAVNAAEASQVPRQEPDLPDNVTPLRGQRR